MIRCIGVQCPKVTSCMHFGIDCVEAELELTDELCMKAFIIDNGTDTDLMDEDTAMHLAEQFYHHSDI